MRFRMHFECWNKRGMRSDFLELMNIRNSGLESAGLACGYAVRRGREVDDGGIVPSVQVNYLLSRWVG